MVRIELAYNPFKVETTVVYDGTVQVAGMDLYIRHGQRLQTWIDTFIEELSGKVNDKQIELVFRGTCMDGRDVKQCVEAARKADPTLQIQLDTTHAVSVTPDEKLKALKKLVQSAIKKSPFDCFKRDKDFLESIECALAPEFEVNVVATMKAGKSTLINALIGRDLMPAASKATTAKIAKIKDCDQRETFRGRVANDIGKWGKWQPASAPLIETWNKDPKVCEIELEGNIQAISQGASVRLVLVDTPGPNNSQDKEHRKVTLEALESESLAMVLYVMNVGQSGTDDDKNLLEIVRDILQKGGRQARERFIFVVSKIDDIKLNDGEDPAIRLQEQKVYLQQNGIENACILPLSALLALRVRMKRNGEFVGDHADELEDDLSRLTRRFNKYPAFNMIDLARPVLGGYAYDEFMQRLAAADSEERKVELKSGVPVLEELLNRYINKYAIPIKIKDAIDVLERVVHEAANEQELREALAQTRTRASEIQMEIEGLCGDKMRTEMAARFKDEIESVEYSKSAESVAFEKRLRKEIEAFFTEREGEFNGNEVSSVFAANELNSLIKQASEMSSKFESVMKAQSTRAYNSQMESLRGKYEELVQDLVGKSLPPDSKLKKLATVSLSIPAADQLMLRHKVRRREKVGERYAGQFIKPWTWLTWKDVHQRKEYIDLASAFIAFQRELRDDMTRAFKALDKAIEDGFVEAKGVIKENMQDVETLLEETLVKIRSATTDAKQQQKQIKTNEAKLKWYVDFKQSYEDILSVK
jgi:predicted GTPase